jgi:transcriptional regulator with XRE-family HTH domain
MKRDDKNSKTGRRSATVFNFSFLREMRKSGKLSINELSKLSGVSGAVISKLERNVTSAELDTVYRLAKVFALNSSDFLSLAEMRTSHRKVENSHKTGAFFFREVNFANIRVLLCEKAKKGKEISKPEVHGDDYELCWVIKGKMEVNLPKEKHTLTTGDSIQFDAVLQHSYKTLEDTSFIILHIKKDKRF